MEHIAIIMATYNGQQYLTEQVTSIMENEYKDFVLHMFDDGSKDDTLQIAEKLKETYGDRFVIHKNPENRGIKRNFLCAVKEIEAEYYMFSDQDDFWLPQKIGDSYAFMKEKEKKPDIPLVMFADAKIADEHLNVTASSFHKRENLNTSRLRLKDLIVENKLIGCTVMFNHALKERLSEFPEEIRMHDWWIGLIGAAFGKVEFLNRPMLLYRQHGGNTLGSVSELSYIAKNIWHLKTQRELLYALCRQAGAFADCYRHSLKEDDLVMLETFAAIPEQGFFRRRVTMFANGYTKTGWLRNFGMFVIM